MSSLGFIRILSKYLLVLAMLNFGGMLVKKGYAQVSPELLKAVYIEKFAKFIDWPADLHAKTEDNKFYIYVLGDTTFTNVLKKVYRRQKIKDKEVVIRNVKYFDEINSCHVLFISPKEQNRIAFILKKIADLPILTISEGKDLARKGVIINFISRADKIHFAINETSAYKANLSVNFRLLSAALVIEPLN